LVLLSAPLGFIRRDQRQQSIALPRRNILLFILSVNQQR